MDHDYIKALRKAKGSATQAAKILKCSPTTVCKKIHNSTEIQTALDKIKFDLRYRVKKVNGVSCGQVRLNNNSWFTVDIEDFQRVMQWNWHIHKSDGYPAVHGKPKGSSNLYMSLGKFILHETVKKVTHVDGDFLNNRKSNLATVREAFTRRKLECTYCGVAFHGTYRADTSYRFCCKEHLDSWKKVDPEQRLISARSGLKYGGQNKLYTNEMIQRFLNWEGDGCAFPLCESNRMPRSMWHLCKLHYGRYKQAMRDRAMDYKKRLEQYEEL